MDFFQRLQTMLTPDQGYTRSELFRLRNNVARRPKLSGQVFKCIQDLGISRIKRRTTRGGKCVKLKKFKIKTIVSNRCSTWYVNSSKKTCDLIRICTSNNLINIPCENNTRTLPTVTIGAINCRSINNKASLIIDHIIDNNLDAIALTETWMSSTDICNAPVINSITKHGYRFHHRPRASGKGGGVAIITKEHLTIRHQPNINATSFEATEVVIQAISSCIRLLVIYRIPPSPRNGIPASLFVQEFGDLMEATVSKSGKLLIVGDFNIHWDDRRDHEQKQFSNLLEHFGLHQHIEEPTHQSGHTIDFIISRTSESIVESTSVADLISDHHAVHASLICAQRHPSRESVSVRSLRRIDTSQLRHEISDADFDAVDVDEAVHKYNSILMDLLDTHAPRKTKVIVKKDLREWMNEDILVAKRLKRRAEMKWRKTKLTVFYEIYKEECTIVKNLIADSKCKFYQDKIKNCDGDQGKLFKIVNSLLGRRKSSDLPTIDNLSDATLAESFNDFFIDKVKNIQSDIVILKENTMAMKCPNVRLLLSPCKTTLSKFDLATENEIETIIKKSSKSTCASDPIPTKLMSDLLPELLSPITHIVNLCLSCGMFPSSLKSAIVRPLLKKSTLDCDMYKNYRPVSNLPFLSKVIEKVLAARLFSHMQENNLIEKLQSAYKPLHSTETALLRIHNDILNAIDAGSSVALVMLDLSAAFDTVNHANLLSLLEYHIGVKASALSLFKSYLSDRTQCVSINNAMSELAALVYGVPQGSVLGPIKFCIYTLPLGAIIRHYNVNYHIYADDTQLYVSFSATDFDSELNKLNLCLADIRSWMISNDLKLNDSKTEFLVFKSVRQQINLSEINVHIGDSKIEQSFIAKNLGVMFDSNVSMDKQIANISKCCFFHLKNISSIRNLLTNDAVANLMHSLVSSKLDYCNSLLYGLPKSKIKKLQRIQNVAARILTKSPKDCDIKAVLKDLHWLPVEQRIKFKLLLMVFRALNTTAPDYLCELISLYTPARTLRSADSNLLCIPKTRLKTYGDRAFFSAGPREWNLLPISIREADCVQSFKTKLKTHLFNEYYCD